MIASLWDKRHQTVLKRNLQHRSVLTHKQDLAHYEVHDKMESRRPRARLKASALQYMTQNTEFELESKTPTAFKPISCRLRGIKHDLVYTSMKITHTAVASYSTTWNIHNNLLTTAIFNFITKLLVKTSAQVTSCCDFHYDSYKRAFPH